MHKLLQDSYSTVRNLPRTGAFGRLVIVKNKKTGEEHIAKLPLNADDKNHSSDVLKNEINILRRYTSTRVPTLLDYSTESPHVYFVMPRFDFTLQDVMDTQQITPRQLHKIALQCLRSLETIHSKRVVHRDIKPANIMVDKHNNVVVIIDFGLSKVLPRHVNRQSDDSQIVDEFYNKPRRRRSFVGNKKYASIAAMLRKGVDYKDDLQNLLYTLISCRMELPWTKKKTRRRDEEKEEEDKKEALRKNFNRIIQSKIDFTLPKKFENDKQMLSLFRLLDYTKAKGWYPFYGINYPSVRQCLRKAFKNE